MTVTTARLLLACSLAYGIVDVVDRDFAKSAVPVFLALAFALVAVNLIGKERRDA